MGFLQKKIKEAKLTRETLEFHKNNANLSLVSELVSSCLTTIIYFFSIVYQAAHQNKAFYTMLNNIKFYISMKVGVKRRCCSS